MLKYQVVTLDTNRFGYGQLTSPWTEDIAQAIDEVKEALKRGFLAHIECVRK